MPISKDDFESGLDDEVKKVLNLLSENRDKAFTSKEIAEDLEIEWDNVKRVLGYLRERGNIKFKDIGAYWYYIFQTVEEKEEKKKKRKLF